MILTLLVIPILTALSALLIYQHNGKREFLKFDLVQFVYSFVMAPVLFVWMKSFLFYVLKAELELSLSINDLFIFDSIFSLSFMYIYAFVVIHSLTKTFKMRMLKDPLYDMFHHSEYFHLWLTHVMMFGGGIALSTAFSLINIFLPLPIVAGKSTLFMILGAGIIFGLALFVSVWLSNPLQGNFMRLMKLLFGLAFLIHVISYYVFDPHFSVINGFFWLNFMAFATTVFCSLLLQRSAKANTLVDRLKDYKWGLNIDVMSKKK